MDTPYGRCPVCHLPIVPSRIENEAVCDSGHRYRYEQIETDDGPVYALGRYVGKDDD